MGFKKEHIPKRAFPRWPVALHAQCNGSWGSSECLIIELNEAGASLTSGHNARVGDEMTVAWRFDSDPIQVAGVVRHVSEAHTGIEFLAISRVDRLRIVEFIRARASHSGGVIAQ